MSHGIKHVLGTELRQSIALNHVTGQYTQRRGFVPSGVVRENKNLQNVDQERIKAITKFIICCEYEKLES